LKRILAACLFLALAAALSAQTPVPLPISGNLGTMAGTPMPDAYITLLLENCDGGQPQVTGYSTIVSNSYQFVADSNGAINGTVWANDQITCNGTTGATLYALSLYDPNSNQIGTTQCFAVVHTQSAWNVNSQTPVACGTTPPNPTNGTFGNLTSTGFFQGNNGAYSGTLTVGSVVGHSTLDLPLTGGALSGALSGPTINSVAYPANVTAFQSAVTACSSNACTIGVNANMTFSTNYSVPSNVTLAFANGAQLQPNTGITVTVNGPIQAGPTQIFGGAGTVALGSLVPSAPVQWWGAVADSNHIGSTGTNSTTAFQACLNDVANGSECFVPAGDYKITGTLSITRSGVALRGVSSPVTFAPAWATPHPSRIVTTSATANISTCGAPAPPANVTDVFVENLTLSRGVTPTSEGTGECNATTGIGISSKFNYAAVYRNVSIEDSATGFYYYATGASAKGYTENNDVIWGSNGVSAGTGVYCGYYEDSKDGTASPSLRLRNLDAQAPSISASHPGLTIYGFAAKGKQMSDIHVNHLETYAVDYGISLVGVGMSGFASATDTFFENCVLDNTYVSAVQVSGLSGYGTLSFLDGWAYISAASASPAFDILNSGNVTISHQKIYSPSITAPVISVVGAG
jgi:hypothetical protein